MILLTQKVTGELGKPHPRGHRWSQLRGCHHCTLEPFPAPLPPAFTPGKNALGRWWPDSWPVVCQMEQTCWAKSPVMRRVWGDLQWALGLRVQSLPGAERTSLLSPRIFLSFYVFSICIFFVKIFIYLFLIRTYQSGIKLKRYQKAQMEKESSYADPCPSPSLEAASVPISYSLL